MAIVRKYQNNFTTGVVSPGVYARVDLQKYDSGCKRIENGVIHVHGGISNRPGTEFVDRLPGNGILIPFTYSVEQAYVLCFYEPPTEEYVRMRVYKDGGVVVGADGEPYSIVTPYRKGHELELKFAQSADVMFFAHPLYVPRKLIRKGHADWSFETMSFKPDIKAPTGLQAASEGFEDKSDTYVETTIEYKVATVDAQENESVPSKAVEAVVLSTWPAGARVTLQWENVPEASRYEVYKNSRGYFAWIGSAKVPEGEELPTFIDDNIEGDATMGPKEHRDPFAGLGNKPGVIGIYQQRLIFGRSDNEPQTVWMSETGDFNSMAVAQPLRDDSAITATVDSKQMNEIRHFIPLRDMLMLTSGAEFKVSAGQNSDAISPMSLRFDIQSYWGASNVPPIVSGTSILMVQNSGKAVRDLHYTFAEDGYSGNEVSILAEHLLTSPIHDWAYQQSPYSTVWICLKNGKLLTFTYMRDQEVWAWSEHESSGGKFRSVSVIREGEQDNAYFLVERDGYFFVEYQVRREYGDAIEDSFFVDCGLRYEGEAIAHVEGLIHLHGKEVVALADGSVVKGLTVAPDGSVDLPFPAKKIAVGLSYRLLIETLDPEIRGENGSYVGEKRNIPSAVVVLRESRGPKIGRDEDNLMTLKLPVAAKYNEPPPLFSGEVKVALPGKHEQSATVVMVHDDPLPVTVLAVATHISIG